VVLKDQVAEATLLATDNGRRLAQDVVDIRTAWLSQITARSDSAAWRLEDALFEQPLVNAEYVANILDVSDRTARNAIAALERDDVLSQPPRSDGTGCGRRRQC
jgi:Fic family protein